MMLAEKALRDAGWEEVARSSVAKGEEYYDPETGLLVKASIKPLIQDYIVLRAPRPEPEYKPGTVVWASTSDGKQSLIAVGLPGSMRWIGKAENGLGAVYSQGVEVLRILVYPDGSTTTDDTEWQAGYDEGHLAGSTLSSRFATDNVNRVEVIDDTGRAYVNKPAENVWLSLQDGGQTLKVFTGGTGVTPRPVVGPRPGDSFGKCDIDVDAASERMDAKTRELLEQFWAQFDGKDNTK